MGARKAPNVLWRSGHQGCSGALRGAGNVLVSCPPAQGGDDDYLRGAGQAAPRCPPGRADCPGCKGGPCSRRGLQLVIRAKVMAEHEASLVCGASPWAADKRVAAPVQVADRVPPQSLARDMAFAKLQPRILLAAEAVQAAKLHGEMLPEQQAIMLSARRPGTGTCWTCTSHRQNCHRMRNGGWPRRYGLAPRRTLGRDLRVLWGRTVMGTCLNSLWQRTRSALFCCTFGGARNRQGATRTWSTTSLSSTTG